MVEDVSPAKGPADKAPAAIDPVAGKTVAEILGEIVWLMTQDPVGREMKVSEIERLVMPAILQKRFHIKYTQASSSTNARGLKLKPVAVDIFSDRKTAVVAEKEPNLIASFSLRIGHN